jgi:hypothetical protein
VEYEIGQRWVDLEFNPPTWRDPCGESHSVRLVRMEGKLRGGRGWAWPRRGGAFICEETMEIRN